MHNRVNPFKIINTKNWSVEIAMNTHSITYKKKPGLLKKKMKNSLKIPSDSIIL